MAVAYLELHFKKGNMGWRQFPCSIHHITPGLQCIKVQKKHYDLTRKLNLRWFILYLCWQATLIWTMVGGWWVVISQERHKGEEHRYRHVCSLRSAFASGGGREPCLTRGLEGGDWNATAECQTLCPDGIITDSSKAALHNSASSLPQHIKSRKQEKVKGQDSYQESNLENRSAPIKPCIVNMLKNNKPYWIEGVGCVPVTGVCIRVLV